METKRSRHPLPKYLQSIVLDSPLCLALARLQPLPPAEIFSRLPGFHVVFHGCHMHVSWTFWFRWGKSRNSSRCRYITPRLARLERGNSSSYGSFPADIDNDFSGTSPLTTASKSFFVNFRVLTSLALLYLSFRVHTAFLIGCKVNP